MASQLSLFTEYIPTVAKFPTTRYQGSKQKFVDWIWDCVKDIPFHSALDAFGGTGSVSFRLKEEGKQVTYNDILPFNHIIGKALIENENICLEEFEIEALLRKDADVEYPDFIERTFKDIYFTDEENRWLDVVSTNIRRMDNSYKQAIAYFALFQSCIIKRPYNLFHRKNLYVRLQELGTVVSRRGNTLFLPLSGCVKIKFSYHFVIQSVAKDLNSTYFMYSRFFASLWMTLLFNSDVAL